MMEFYKKRDFGTFISDSFNFFKVYGKNYLKNYILINGALLILLVALFIFVYKEIFSQFFGSNLDGNGTYIENYFDNNIGMIITISIVAILLFILISIVNYLFPVFYMKRLAEGATNVKADDLFGDFKKNIGRIAVLCVGVVFIVAPLSLIIFGLSYALMLILIGFILMLFTAPVLFNVWVFLMFDTFNSNRGFFESLGYAIRSQFSYPNGRENAPFWKYWGASIIMLIILYVINTIFTIIPIMVIFSSSIVSPQGLEDNENPFTGSLGIFIFLIYGVSMLLGFILSNLMYINAGLMYYDSRTDLHQMINLKEIDTIGVDE